MGLEPRPLFVKSLPIVQTPQPCSQGLSSSLPLSRFSGGEKKREPWKRGSVPFSPESSAHFPLTFPFTTSSLHFLHFFLQNVLYCRQNFILPTCDKGCQKGLSLSHLLPFNVSCLIDKWREKATVIATVIVIIRFTNLSETTVRATHEANQY